MKSIDLHGAQAGLEEAFGVNEYKKCYAMIESDPLLFFTETRRKLDLRFGELLKESIGLIMNGKLEEAVRLLKPFEADSRHAKKIQANIKFAKKIYDFAQLIAKGDLDMAYRVAQTDEKYKELSIFEKMEQDFSSAFDNATYLLT